MRKPSKADLDFSYMRVEVTVAGAIVDPDQQIVGKNMVDATLVFGWRCGDARGRSDEAIHKALSHQLSPVMAVISAALQQQGWIAMDQTDEPMKENSTQVGSGHGTPVTVMLWNENEGGHA